MSFIPPYTCPQCKGTNLHVHVLATAKLVQSPDRAHAEIHADSIADWDGSNTMWCNDCGYCEGAVSFYNPEFKSC